MTRSENISHAMVLAAGLGTRFRAVDATKPKPMVDVGGKPLIDWTLDMLGQGGVQTATVNIHHLAEQIESHLQGRTLPAITLSDERGELLETGGALMKAFPAPVSSPIFCTNTDAIFDPGRPSPLSALRQGWDDEGMDALLTLVPLDHVTGYEGDGDFFLSDDGRVSWDGDGERYVFTGLQLIHPRLWQGLPVARCSTRRFWDAAMERGRLAGMVYDGTWMHVGDPAGYEAAQSRLGMGG